MISEQDVLTLQEAGIYDLDTLATAAAAYLREYKGFRHPPIPNALSEAEEAFLIQGGAEGVKPQTRRAETRNITTLAAEYAQMVATALTQKEAAKELDVSTGRVRQRIDSGSLYALDTPAGRVCPKWQFHRGALPGLEDVLQAIDHDVHPVAMERFFLTESSDLYSDMVGRNLSPRDWLLSGHSPAPVVMMALEL